MQAPNTSIPASMRPKVLSMLTSAMGLSIEEDPESLLDRLSWSQLKGGSFLFHQGDPPDAAYLLVHGHMKALRVQGGKHRVLGDIVPGQMIGEMGLISQEVRNADVVAARDCHLVRMSKSDFKMLFMKYPEWGWDLAELIIQRTSMRSRSRKPRKVKNIALVAAHPSLSLEPFIESLREVMAPQRVAVMRKSMYESMSETELVAKVDQFDAECSLLFMKTHPDHYEWNQFCYRQADEIMMIAESPDRIHPTSAQPFQWENSYLSHHTLVVLHPEKSSLPSGTARYFEQMDFDFSFHLRADHPQDLLRLKRHLTDHTVGIVLAGGGARGFAHLGAWKAIRELNIPIDRIGGTSIGGFLGAIMAHDYDYEHIYEIVRDIVLRNPSSDLNPVPYASIIQGKKLDRALLKHYQQKDILDCPIPFYCVSMNLTTVEPFVHSRGNLFMATRASGSLPGIMPPVPINGNWHVDGAIVNNFPVPQMVDFGTQHIIGVSLDQEDNPGTGHTNIPGLRSQIVHGLLKRNPDLRIPSLIETVMLSTVANSHQRQLASEREVDLLIRPEVKGVGLLEWKSFDLAVEAGYQTALKAFSDWKPEGLELP